jgi:RNA polymerase sigma factor FliA
MPERDSLQRKESILLLTQRIAELPRIQKKVLAMYYFANIPLADIACCLGLSQAGTCQVLIRTVELLQSCLLQIASTPRSKDGHKDQPDQQGESAIHDA